MAWVFGLIVILMVPSAAAAHCDGLDGPVVTAARAALRAGDVSLALVWVQTADEPEVRAAFDRALAVRKLGSDAKELADLYFFETLVRVHRAGEGAPFTGLKPAGRDLGPAIPAADRALQSGDAEPLVKLLTQAMSEGIREQFGHARQLRSYPPSDVEAGRSYVGAYVGFVHYVEGLWAASERRPDGHYVESRAPGGAHDEH